MPKPAFPAAAEGMPTPSRRSFLQGLTSAGVVVGVQSSTPPAPIVVTRGEPEERLRHHLAMAAQVLDELAPGSDSRWQVTLGGKASSDRRFVHAQRFYLVPDSAIAGLMIERPGEIFRGDL
jgi:hypothetical protein